MNKLIFVLFLSLCSFLSPLSVYASEVTVKIGVLSHRGDLSTLRHWAPTADYLSNQIEGFVFEIIPLDFDEIDPAIANQEIDFLLTNPGIYVTMEVRHRISRIATMDNLFDGKPLNIFGGVIFTSSKNKDIHSLQDLVGRSFMGVDETSLGGFQMAWREMKKAQIDPYSDISRLEFGGIHDEVVKAVVTGKVDVGTVRTGILDNMAQEGLINLDDIKVINANRVENFPLLLSTSLYPEWPFSKLQHTSNGLAERVAITLLRMSDIDPAAQWGDYAGWNIPLEYQPVHELLSELVLPPYDKIRAFTWRDVVSRYYAWIITIAILMLTLTAMTIFISRLHRKLEESKRLLEQQHVQILNSVADGIYGVDLNGNSTFMNRAMEEMTGWSNKEVIGKNQHELLHHTKHDGSPHPAKECPVYLTFVDNKARFIEEDLFWKKDGSSFPVEYSSTPVRDENGQTVGSVVVFRDISLKKQSREEAERYQRELAHVARLSTMGEMASGLAHELNQPLTAIATNADACIRLIESDGASEKVAEVLEKIGIQARHAGEIIRHLRKFVRKEEPELTPVNINDLIDEVLLLVRTDLDKNRIKVSKALDVSLPPVTAQHIHIDQVLLNLIRNAVEAMSVVDEGDKLLSLSTERQNDTEIIVRVGDTGPGLEPDIQENLFTPFMTTKRKGMGLGLSLSHGIIASHKGKLFLESSTAKGSVFCFTLKINHEVAANSHTGT